MKTPRIFILIGAFALLFCAAAISLEAQLSPAAASGLPILRADPRSGDPDSPDGGFALPMDEWDGSTAPLDESRLGTSQVFPGRFKIATLWSWWMRRAKLGFLVHSSLR